MLEMHEFCFTREKKMKMKIIENPKSERMLNTMACLLESPNNQLLNHRKKSSIIIVPSFCLSITLDILNSRFPIAKTIFII